MSVTNTIPSLKYRQPKAVIVTKMQQIPSRRTANHREVVKKRNQASVGKKIPFACCHLYNFYIEILENIPKYSTDKNQTFWVLFTVSKGYSSLFFNSLEPNLTECLAGNLKRKVFES